MHHSKNFTGAKLHHSKNFHRNLTFFLQYRVLIATSIREVVAVALDFLPHSGRETFAGIGGVGGDGMADLGRRDRKEGGRDKGKALLRYSVLSRGGLPRSFGGIDIKSIP